MTDQLTATLEPGAGDAKFTVAPAMNWTESPARAVASATLPTDDDRRG